MAKGSSAVVVGPSGCGKSLLAKYVGVRCVEKGKIPVIVEAKYFSGEFREVLNQETALLDVPSITALTAAGMALEASLVVILDGFNECPRHLRERLSRCLRAIAVRAGASLIVTSQEQFSELDIRISTWSMCVSRARR